MEVHLYKIYFSLAAFNILPLSLNSNNWFILCPIYSYLVECYLGYFELCESGCSFSSLDLGSIQPLFIEILFLSCPVSSPSTLSIMHILVHLIVCYTPIRLSSLIFVFCLYALLNGEFQMACCKVC